MHPSGYLIQQFEGNWHFEQFNPHSQPVKVHAAFMVYIREREIQKERESRGREREGERERVRERERE